MLALVGCGSDPLPFLPTDGAVARGGGPVDLLQPHCAELAAGAQRLIGDNTGCAVDSDCLPVIVECTLPGACAVYVNSSGYRDVVAAIHRLAVHCAPAGGCPSCMPQYLACVAGHCAAAPLPNVGAACTDASQCAGWGRLYAWCQASQNPDRQFPNGYCLLACNNGFSTCPLPGMTCQSIAPNSDPNGCFKQCGADNDCRVKEGYRCCQSFANGPRFCYPAPCPI